MTLPDAALAAPPDLCSACGGPLDVLGRCAKCGAVFGEAYRCPLCQALSDVESDQDLYYRCRACGGPRIPPTETPPSEAELELLRRARREQLRRTAFRAGYRFAFGSGVLSVLVTSLVLSAISAPPFARWAALLASLVPFALGVFAMRRAQSHERSLSALLDESWLRATTRVVSEQGANCTPATIARALRVDEARAELLLAEVTVQDFVSNPPALGARMRVTELVAPSEPPPGAERPRAHADASKP